MGLDMYLTGKRYIWQDERGKIKITGIPTAKQPKSIDFDYGYWRKANAIHKWFVDNVQDGEDNCREYYVSREDLQRLLDTVNKVLDSIELIDGDVVTGTRFEGDKAVPVIEKGKIVADDSVAKELLPTEGGFFFGSTEYTEWYVNYLKETHDILVDALKAPIEVEFHYDSSW